MNYSKLLRHNLSKPISARISHSAIQDKIEAAIFRRTSYAELLRIHSNIMDEISPKIQALRKQQDLLESLVSVSPIYRGTEKEKRNLNFSSGGGGLDIYTLGNARANPNDLVNENLGEMSGFFKAACQKAENEKIQASNDENQRIAA